MAPRRSGVFSAGGGTALAVTNVSAAIPLPPGGSSRIRATNTGAAAVHIRVGDSAVTATTADSVVAPGDVRDFDIDPAGDRWLAAISPAAGPTALQISRESGAVYA